jgi:hypothetical protein
MKLATIVCSVAIGGLLLVGCPTDDDDDTTVEVCPMAETPTADIIQPSNTAQFESGVEVQFVAKVDDDLDAPQSLETHWYDALYLEPEEFPAPAPDVNGEMRFTRSDFTNGIHTLTLEVFDSDGCRGEDKIVINVGAEM